jgi:hypothetical protein
MPQHDHQKYEAPKDHRGSARERLLEATPSSSQIMVP